MASKPRQPEHRREEQVEDRNLQLAAQQNGDNSLFGQSEDLIEKILDPEFRDGKEVDLEWLEDATRDHLHRDQILSIMNEREEWERRWLNPNRADDIIMSYPSSESRTNNDRVERVRQRVRGDDKAPLTNEQKRRIRAALERKTDRERRSRSGTFVELLLKDVLRSEHGTTETREDRSVMDKVLGRE